MEYAGVSPRSGFYRFRLNGRHKGDNVYAGCSGAPIAADDGRIVAPLQGGCADENVVYGVPMQLYARALQ